MKLTKILTALAAIGITTQISVADQLKISDKQGSRNDFPIVSSKGIPAPLYISPGQPPVIEKAAGLFADDVKAVTGKKPEVKLTTPTGKNIIVAGIIGSNHYIDSLINAGRIDATQIRNGWEQFMITTVNRPSRGVDKALFVIGSDRRAVAYALFSISESMGVSPFYWWADIPVESKPAAYLSPVNLTSASPSVKYRGIFINDEGWGFRPWAAKTFEPEVGNIGPRTYAKVCELLLRLKANMLAPAMHPGSLSFNQHPQNKLVADSFAIVMSSSHCEPLLLNNVSEWDSNVNGEWNYVTNRDGIVKVLDKRLEDNGRFENVYTLAMRGIHDSGIVGVAPEDEVKLVQSVLNDQRDIIALHVDTPLTETPQIFVPYKEVMDIYERGLKVPDDVTLVWPDDNYGFIKRLSDRTERQRSGRSGVYYHISYCGEPHDYLWLNTTPNTLIYEEMKKAYDTGADRYWLLNVGDIKPGEIGMKYFFDLAWDINRFNFDNSHTFAAEWLASIFGKELTDELQQIMEQYFLLGFQHKPESMGWGYEWNNYHDRERVIDTDFSFVNYNEAENRMAAYDNLTERSRNILESLPEKLRPAYFELVHYPVEGSALMNKKMLTAQKNRWYAMQRRAATNKTADEARHYHNQLDSLTLLFNTMLNGKWNGMMSITPGWTATYQEMPPLTEITVPQTGEPAIFIPGGRLTYGTAEPLTFPCFNSLASESSFFEIYNRGTSPIVWSAEASQPYVKLGLTSGTLTDQQRVSLDIDWEKLPAGKTHLATVTVSAAGHAPIEINVPVFNPGKELRDSLIGTYAEINGCVAINAGDYHRVVNNENIEIRKIKGLGYDLESIQLGDPLAAGPNMWRNDIGPRAEYDFYTFNSGNVTVTAYALPLFPLTSRHNTYYGIMIDDGMVQWCTTNSKEYSSQWRNNVFRNTAPATFSFNIDKPGPHTLKIICGNPGMIVQKVLIDFGGAKPSYLGPPATIVR